MQLKTKSQIKNMIAQESARIMVEQGVEKYHTAKYKAAENLNFHNLGCLPRNADIEVKLKEYYRLFDDQSHQYSILRLRKIALSIMELLAIFQTFLVGPVANGTASSSSPINIHLTADNIEELMGQLDKEAITYKLYERQLKTGSQSTKSFKGLAFIYEKINIEITVFSHKEIRQIPVSRIDKKPMQRTKLKALKKLLATSCPII